MELSVLIPVTIALVGPIGAYLVASRRLSGKIGTSEAGDLWKESQSIRNDYRDRLGVADDRTRDLEKRVAKLEELNNDLVRENIHCRGEVAELKATISVLRATITKLEEALTKEREE